MSFTASSVNVAEAKQNVAPGSAAISQSQRLCLEEFLIPLRLFYGSKEYLYGRKPDHPLFWSECITCEPRANDQCGYCEEEPALRQDKWS